ncbi:MAG TPA: molybdopterin cofactor-binding domain-containing protein, partial [Burkholderiales bacterium]
MAEPAQIAFAGQSLPHEGAPLHVSGAANYSDDIPLPENALHVALGMSTIAHGRIRSMDLSAVAAAPGVVAIVTAADVPGSNMIGPILHDDPIFAQSLVEFAGQSLFAVAATSYGAARRAAKLARVEYEELPAILDIRGALAAKSFVVPTQTLRRGEPETAIGRARHRLSGSAQLGGQEHFYLEGQVAVAVPQEDGGMLVYSSTQHPTEVQHMVAHALGRKSHEIMVQCRRM